jgi:pyrimidine operon attenuation protein/uracil phosphoribosyltransferase
LAERERKRTPPYGGVFVAQNTVLDASAVDRAVRRMAHEVIERNSGLDDVVIIGLQTGGVPFAGALASALATIEGVEVPVGRLDVAFYRDDINLRPVLPEAVTDVSFDVNRKIVVLVDDVLFTGRTIRAALDAIIDQGRPRAIQLAVMVDRGHRELPIRPDFVGKNLPTRRDEAVNATLEGVELGEVEKQPGSRELPEPGGHA